MEKVIVKFLGRIPRCRPKGRASPDLAPGVEGTGEMCLLKGLPTTGPGWALTGMLKDVVWASISLHTDLCNFNDVFHLEAAGHYL